MLLKARLEHDTVYGRCLATSEAVERGELVVEELPFAYGPKRESGIVCLGCYRYLQFGEDGDSLDRCELCDWPLCGNCADDASSDHRGECQVFGTARVTFAGNVGEDGVCPQLDCITPLRLVCGCPRGGRPPRGCSHSKTTTKKKNNQKKMEIQKSKKLLSVSQQFR
ncbi:GH13589 [Drosophila grimshawi]|uniref:GH13589 n=1 Tax=Drosophila grimshawi TaxID=7222 RepID=B4JPV0_DROGR|nr:GH13589 [Drosophila grimshawi]